MRGMFWCVSRLLATTRRASRASLQMQLAAPHQAPGNIGRLQRRAFSW
jgi:hypothetical protein